MKKLRGFFFASSAVFLLAAASSAADRTLLALNAPARQDLPKLSAQLKETVTTQARIDPGYSDFDAVSVNDPLYREGAKEMLKRVIKEVPAAPAKDPRKPELRDAPVSRDAAPARVIKKPAVKKPVHSDPVKVKNAL